MMKTGLIPIVLVVLGLILNTAYILGPSERNLISGNAGYPGLEESEGTGVGIISISLDVTTVDFGQLNNGETDDTTDFSPPPLDLQNTGNRQVDVTIMADDLWGSVPNPSRYFQFMSAEAETGSVDNPATDLVTSFTDLPSSPTLFARKFHSYLARDELYGHIKIIVPEEEEAGEKESVIVFTASLS